MTGDSCQRDLPATKAKPSQIVQVTAAAAISNSAIRATWRRIAWQKILLFTTSLLLFILAISLMKEGAHGLAPLVDNHLAVFNPFNSLGFGWLFSYIVMSGSPVAATSLSFFDAGIIDKVNAYTMITGSRLGASFAVLFIGFLCVLRGGNRAESLGIGLLSLSVTGTTYVIALGLGYIFLNSGLLDGVQLHTGTVLNSVTDLIFDPVARFFINLLPQWTLFLMGLAIILLSFNLFDRCLPQKTLKKSRLGRMSRLIYRPCVMFLLGGLVTLVSMSVSVSLGILVPLSARGFVRRENLVSYIMGANITTFIDTLLAAVLLRNPAAFTIVLVEMVSIALVSIVILVAVYHRYERGMLLFVDWLTTSKRKLGLFIFIIFALPLILLLL